MVAMARDADVPNGDGAGVGAQRPSGAPTRGSGAPVVTFPARSVARRRLVCLPYAGGGPSTYRLWPHSLPDDVEVVVAVLPGRDPRNRPAGTRPTGSMAALVPTVTEAIATLQSSSPLPFAVFGHSMGALVAYEVTVALEAGSATPPEHLFVSGRRPPDEVHAGERIHALPDVDFLDRVQELYGGVPDVIRGEPDLLALFLPALRADIEVFETYSPLTGRAVCCPVRAYGGDRDTRPRPEALAGWSRFAAGDFTHRVMRGDHFYLNDARDELTADVVAAWQAVSTAGSPAAELA